MNVLYVCMYVCVYVCIDVCMYVCVCVFACTTPLYLYALGFHLREQMSSFMIGQREQI